MDPDRTPPERNNLIRVFIVCHLDKRQGSKNELTLKAQSKIAADGTLFFYFYLSMEIKLDVSCESSA